MMQIKRQPTVTVTDTNHLNAQLPQLTHSYTHLGGLGLAGACRAGRGPSKLQVEGPREGEVASVGEGGDHKTSCVAKVLIPVDKYCVHSTHQHLVLPVVAVVCVCVCVCVCV